MKNLISRHFLLLCVSASLVAFLSGRAAGMNLESIVLAATVLSLVGAVVLERFLPYRADWNGFRSDSKVDLTSAAVLVGLIDPALKVLVPIAVVAAAGVVALPAFAASGLAELPFAVQLIAATLLIELGRYASHRLHHAKRPLWWLHAMHHSSERLYAINNLRFHPLNHALNYLFGMLPAIWLGFSTEVLLGYLALTQPVLMLQHANIDLKNGWLNHVFSTNELHRWHHSTEVGKADSNFGNALIVWDQVFGTYRPALAGPSSHTVGLFASSRSYPAASGYLAQLRSMFTPACCAA